MEIRVEFWVELGCCAWGSHSGFEGRVKTRTLPGQDPRWRLLRGNGLTPHNLNGMFGVSVAQFVVSPPLRLKLREERFVADVPAVSVDRSKSDGRMKAGRMPNEFEQSKWSR